MSSNGVTNSLVGAVERTGRLWVENVPLSTGTNWLTLVTTDVWSNTYTTNLSVIYSDFDLTVNDLPTNDLHQATVTVSGTLTNEEYTVWVNGIQAGVTNGNWQANDVLVGAGGTALFNVTAYPPGENPEPDANNPTMNPPSPNAKTVLLPVDKRERVWVERDSQTWTYHSEAWWPEYGQKVLRTVDRSYTHIWNDQRISRGSFKDAGSYGDYLCKYTFTWPATPWPDLEAGTAIGEEDCPGTTTWPAATIEGEFCGVSDSQRTGNANIGTFDRHCRAARTKIKCYTGGKAGDQSIYVGNGSAQEILWLRAIPPYCPPTLHAYNQKEIPADKIELGDFGDLGSDGLAYAAWGNDEVHDITPRVKGKNFYKFDVDASKHTLVHATQCAALTNPDSSRTQLGVGEYVDFGFDPPLYMSPPEAPVWFAFAGSVTPGTGSTTVYTAPSNTAIATVRVYVRGVFLDTVFGVREPTVVDEAETYKVDDFHYNPGVSAAGMKLRVYLAPTFVSFCRVECKEIKTNPVNLEGYYADTTLVPFPNIQLAHSTADEWFQIFQDNSWEHDNGNQRDWDRCYFVNWDVPPTLYAGKFKWYIPIRWRIQGTGEGTLLNQNYYQEFEVTNDGAMKVKKFGKEVIRSIDHE